MSIKDKFEKDRYVHLEGFLDKENCRELTEALKAEIETRGWFDKQCPTSKSIRDSVTFDKLLVDLLPHFEEASGLKLLPTYAYARWYEPGEILKIHRDRPSCEVSATLTLGFDGDVWPIFIGHPSGEPTSFRRVDEAKNIVHAKNVSKISMGVGDAVLYRGCEMYHWRDEYSEGRWQAQVFLHYVDANGPHAEWVYDKRGKLNLPSDTPNEPDNDLTTWIYTDVLTDKDCEALVKLYTQAPDEEASIGGGGVGAVDKTVRNVNRVVLPVYKGIGARLAAVGLDANAQRWGFDIKKANQSEFLKYPSGGGRYKGHIDTFLSKSPENLLECRKVTVLAFLNDDYKGGKFFLQTGHKKIYPPQKKGTVIAFPSFILHGVEDVEEGERYSVVTWLVGPWFK
jgi:predicted 2-oxoglutarate/Fe(II)-dependent dioxygenase YbiX